MNTIDPTYQQNSRSIFSQEQNYIGLFAMRYPASFSYVSTCNSPTTINRACILHAYDTVVAKKYTKLTGSTLVSLKMGKKLSNNEQQISLTQVFTRYFMRQPQSNRHLKSQPEIGLILVGKRRRSHFIFFVIKKNKKQKKHLSIIFFAKLAI